jgi:hypothetical protein
VENLPIIVNDENISVTRLLGISPAKAIKKKMVIAKPSNPRKGPMGFDEERLSYDNSVLYLLDLSEYEGGRRRATDMNWSSKIYQIIRESLIQKNQPCSPSKCYHYSMLDGEAFCSRHAFRYGLIYACYWYGLRLFISMQI